MKKSDLSFNIDDLSFVHKNNFLDDDIDYIFSNKDFLFWIYIRKGVITGVGNTDMWELEEWGKEFTKKEFKQHLKDTEILEKFYKEELESKINKISPKK